MEIPSEKRQHHHSSSKWLPLLGILLLGALAGMIACNCVHHAAPNEWLLVVDGQGEQTKAVVGGTHVSSPWEQVVKFPSNLQKVSFKAQQVTREMQGIEVSGFASWVVYREDSGPLKAFRHLDGLTPEGIEAANDSLRDMAESILRAKLANLTIAEVITSREYLRDVCQKSMMEVVRGWGVWIETLEVTDVKILSASLFKNMQTQFREATRLEAEMRQLATQRQIHRRQLQLEQERVEQEAEIASRVAAMRHEKDKAELELELERTNLRAEMEKRQAVYQAEQELLLQEQQSALAKKKLDLELLRSQREHEAEMQREQQKLELERLRAEHRRQEEIKAHSLGISQLKEKLAVETTMTEANHRSALLDATKQVYSKLPLKDVKLVNFGAMPGGGAGNSSDLLPWLWAGMNS